MAAETKTLELTEKEATLRQLFLDVADYIGTKTVLRFAGGWVRDRLLGDESHDIDVALSDMSGVKFAEKINEYLMIPGNPAKYDIKIPEGSEGLKFFKVEANPEKSKHLETATMNILGFDIDFSNLRKETYTEDSRNPEIVPGTAEEDSLRRDATINAMFFNINDSVVEDFTGKGFKDMASKILRTPMEPYQTFRDDPLRVLRLIRFASRLEYTIDPAAEEAMGNSEIKDALKRKISRERVLEELHKMLKGKHPRTALEYIDRLGLYYQVFSDPAKDYEFKPDVSLLKPCYQYMDELVPSPKFFDDLPSSEDAASSPSTFLRTLLIPNADQAYYSWLLAALVPYTGAPAVAWNPKKTEKTVPLTELVVREGIKESHKFVDLVRHCSKNYSEIREFKDSLLAQKKDSKKKSGQTDYTTRDTLGMAIRKWGETWRNQTLFALLNEVADAPERRETITSEYATFLSHIKELDLLEACSLKPMINGKDLSAAMSTKPGPWMKEALEVIMAWQLVHSDFTDQSAVLETLKPQITDVRDRYAEAAKANGKPAGELSVRLAHHFLSLTIRPLFSQGGNRSSKVTESGRRKTKESLTTRFSGISMEDEEEAGPLWKKSENQHFLPLLRWCIEILDREGIEKNWPLLVPPILTMIDDIDLVFKTRGTSLLHLLLESVDPNFLSITGLFSVFKDALIPNLSHLPTLTPESEAIPLLNATYPTLLTLYKLPHHVQPNKKSQEATSTTTLMNAKKPYDELVRQILSAFTMTGVEHIKLSSCLLGHLRSILSELGIHSVKHLQNLLPLLSSILSHPMGPLGLGLLAEAAKTLKCVILNAWPRVGWHWRRVLEGVCNAWMRLDKEVGEERREEIEMVKGELREVVELVVEVLKSNDGEFEGWRDEMGLLTEKFESMNGLFEGLIDG